MHDLSNLGPRIIASVGGIPVTETVIFAVILAGILIALAAWSTRRLEKYPSKKQVVAEFIVESIYNFTSNTMGAQNIKFSPYVGTMFIFLLIGNSLGLIGIRPVTADVNMTFAFALITFFLIQYNGIKSSGFVGKLKHMCDPYPFMFPMKIIEEFSFPISLGFRLFGNIIGGVIVMALIFMGLEFISESVGLPIPLFQAIIPLPANLFFDVFEPILQAFIFTTLSMVFIFREIVIHGDEEHH